MLIINKLKRYNLKKLFILSVIFMTFYGLSLLEGCSKKPKEQIFIKAPLELKIPLELLIKSYERSNKNIEIILEYKTSKDLIKDLGYYNKIDLLILDSEDEKINNFQTKRTLLKNDLVVVGRRKIDNLDGITRHTIAIGNPENTVFGVISIIMLDKYKVWGEIRKEVIYSADSLSAIQAVDLNEVDFAIIPLSLVKLLKNTEIVYEIPESFYTPIYYTFVLKNKTRTASREFYEFLLKPNNLGMFKKYNLTLIPERK